MLRIEFSEPRAQRPFAIGDQSHFRLGLFIPVRDAQSYSNPARERRTTDEIVVDAHIEAERAMRWHCYLKDKLEFRFRARCVAARTMSPLKTDEQVDVLAMAKEDGPPASEPPQAGLRAIIGGYVLEANGRV